MVEADRVEEDLEFKWGKKKGVGGKKKDFQFYQSFTYDGVEYELYDCVYLLAAGESEPHIGKLIKILENPLKKKTVKVLWFFRPCEMLKYPGVVVDTAENELFLASGEGAGLANMNPLEAIAGKCNVVCTSKDSRNPQPSDEELQKADFIFYRGFDVKDLKILDKIEEKVAGIEVKCMFNRPGLQKPGVLNLDSDKKGVGGNAVAGNETEVPSKRNPSKEHTTLSTNRISVDSLGKEHADSNASLVKRKASLRENPAYSVGVEIGEMPLNNDEMENVSVDHTKSRSEVRENTDSKASLEEKVKSAKDCGDLDDRPAKKAKIEGSIKVSDDKNEKNMQKLSVDLDGNDPKALATIAASEEKPTLKLAEDSQGAEKGPSKEVPDEKTKHSNGKLLEASQRQSPDVDKKMDHQIMEVARRTDVDSAWNAFQKSCTAKMMQRSSISSTHADENLKDEASMHVAQASSKLKGGKKKMGNKRDGKQVAIGVNKVGNKGFRDHIIERKENVPNA
ncbi:protein ANTI-SILENCING 1-like [Corylus avellana]|uniref:protein ANTI-SILENCING 1-like n=1 Tax=Corylus avellana TaxID=13451 RepID=UPI00286A4509|nr:protein ANTI-SILENCING 1-like [Corylus avellana]